MMRLKFLFIVLVLALDSCTQKSEKTENQTALPEGYSFEEMKKIQLEKELKEISGIAWYDSDLLAIEDESAAIYRLDPSSGKIKTKTKFGKNEDIEDILVLGDTIWALRSNGNLYQIVNFEDTATIETQLFEFPIRESRDFEGITSGFPEPILWVFCKVCEWDSDEASIFRFDLSTMEFDSNMDLKLDKNELGNLLSAKELEKLKLQPSAVALHPLTNEYFLLSSTGKWLMTLDRNMKPLSIHLLKASLFPQPEGMTFDSEGNLYISNEGGDGKANILIFQYQR